MSAELFVHPQTVSYRVGRLRDLLGGAVLATTSDGRVLGQVGQVIEPVIRPLGFDWTIGVGLISLFTVLIASVKATAAEHLAVSVVPPASDFARASGEDPSSTSVVLGIRAWF